MHNLISYNQLAFWKHSEKETEDDELVNDYYRCLTECNDDTQTCKRTCRLVFMK